MHGTQIDLEMKISAQDVARMLGVSEDRVFAWTRADDMPCTRVHDQYRFNRAEIIEWATARGMAVNFDALAPSSEPPHATLRLADALERGGVYHDVPGDARDSVLRAVVAALPIPDEADRELLFDVLVAREALGSTGMGDGIAIPHARNPLIMNVDEAFIALCFLRTPVDFGAIDGKPVTTLFALVSSSVRNHLQLLSRISLAVQDPELRKALTARASREDILAHARRIDASVGARGLK